MEEFARLSRRKKRVEQLIARREGERALRGFAMTAVARLSPCQCLEDFHTPDNTVSIPVLKIPHLNDQKL
jgi:hypothetical protein